MKIKNPTQRRKGPARQAATKEFEQEQTEKTETEKLCRKCTVLGNSTAKTQEKAQDKNLHHRGRAELPLCPEFLGGAAAPPYQRRGDFCPWSRKSFPLFAPLQCYIGKLRIFRKVFPPLFSLCAPVQVLWLRLAALQCYFRELCIFDKVFPPLFSLCARVQVLWLRLAALRLRVFALNPQSAIP